jgi:hypothetical protein
MTFVDSDGDPSLVNPSQTQEGYFLQNPDMTFVDSDGDPSLVNPSQTQD